MKRIIYLIAVVLATVSCSNNDKEVASLVQVKIETMSGHEVVRDLLIENDGDVEQLARIFKCSVPTINRIKNKETYLTDNALSEFKNLLFAVKVSGKDTFKDNDPYYESWVRSFRYWLNERIFWAIGLFVIATILGAIIGGIIGSRYDNGIDEVSSIVKPIRYIQIPLLVIFGGGYLITWIANMIWSYEQPANLFIEKINPVFETLL